MNNPILIRDAQRLMKPIVRPPLPVLSLTCGSCAFVASGSSPAAVDEGLREHRRYAHLSAPPRLRIETEAA